MTTKNAFFSVQLLLVFSLWFLTMPTYAQNGVSCGFTMSPAERAEYESVMAQFHNQPEQSFSNMPLNGSIPIYIWVNKSSPWIIPTALELTQLIDDVNTFFNFPNGVRFTFCGVSYLNDSRWYMMNNPSFPNINVFNTYHRENAIDVYMPESGIVNFAGGPEGSRIVFLENDARTLAHELGHVFGLAHTFNEENTLPERVIRAIDPSRANPPNWRTTADGMLTHADPFPCRTFASNQPCPYVDDNQDPYTPPYTNLMSYHPEYSVFTAEQQNKMNFILALPTGRNYLLNAPCVEDIANIGQIRRSFSDDCQTAPLFLKNVNISVQNSSNSASFCSSITSDASGYYRSCSFPKNSSVTITPTRNTNPKEGVTTWDVALMSRHILGIEPFIYPYQMLAADVNNSGDIDGTDMLITRRVLLSILPNFPVGSWRFVPNFFLQQQAFKNQFDIDPFTATFGGYCYDPNSCTSYMDKIQLDMSLNESKTSYAWSFSPFKVGDVNYCNTTYGVNGPPQGPGDPSSFSSARTANNSYQLRTSARTSSMRKNDDKTIVLRSKSAGNVVALQIGMRFLQSKFKIKDIEKGDFNTDNDLFDFNREDKGELRVLWFNKRGHTKNIRVGTVLLKAKVKANENIDDLLNVLNLDDQILKTEFYGENGNLIPMDLEWDDEDDNGNSNGNNTIAVNTFPNPFTNEFTFEINSPVAAPATITISNVITRQNVVIQRQLLRGLNVVNINNTASLPAGILTYSIVVGNNIVNGTITKAR